MSYAGGTDLMRPPNTIERGFISYIRCALVTNMSLTRGRNILCTWIYFIVHGGFERL